MPKLKRCHKDCPSFACINSLPPVEIITEDVFACELTEEQVAIARDKFRGEPKPLILDPEEQSEHSHELEAATRKRAGK